MNSAGNIKIEVSQANQGIKIRKIFDEQVENAIQSINLNSDGKIKDEELSIENKQNVNQNLKIN